jgi:hypothetical protein
MRVSMNMMRSSRIRTVMIARQTPNNPTILVETSYNHEQTPAVLNKILNLIDMEQEEMSQRQDPELDEEDIDLDEDTYRVLLYEE